MERLEKALRKAFNTPDGDLLPLPPRLPARPDTPPEEAPATLLVSPGTPPARSAEAAALWHDIREVRPSFRALSSGLVVTAAEEPDAGHFELLGAKLLHQVRSQGWRRIGIAAPRAGCGATTVALNLAFGLAQQAELRILLVEADLRRPSMAATLGLGPTAGLSELAEGRAEPAQALLRLRSNLAALLAPGPLRNPAALLNAPEGDEAVERLETLLEPSVILLDLPPLLGGDARTLLDGLDGVLVVAAAGSTTIPEIEACQRELTGRTALVGVVVNRCRDLGLTKGLGLAGQRRGGLGLWR